MADLQKFRDELKQLRKSLGGETAKDSCDAYWKCLDGCATLGCSHGCCQSYPTCCSSAVNAKVKELITKHFGAAA